MSPSINADTTLPAIEQARNEVHNFKPGVAKAEPKLAPNQTGHLPFMTDDYEKLSVYAHHLFESHRRAAQNNQNLLKTISDLEMIIEKQHAIIESSKTDFLKLHEHNQTLERQQAELQERIVAECTQKFSAELERMRNHIKTLETTAKLKPTHTASDRSSYSDQSQQ